jgi:fructose-1,6-bisphosphatase I
MVNALRASGKTAVLVSEELEEAIIIEDAYKGKYCVVFDPLDGSSNIDAGVNIGTIFGIYKIVSASVCRSTPDLYSYRILQKDGSPGSIRDVLRPGNEMAAAGYIMSVLVSHRQVFRR